MEILTDDVPKDNCEIQTEFYIDRPNDRLFIPFKDGEDKDT